ncbi:MAG: hypothetical protein DHS20C12_28600 [Pseudohongiella sp.]|nr:MAG: hypothetical protein DHS20C12_28600 [Pseudohongiella sp.]
MKLLKILGIVFASYVGLVVVFESLLGYFQPTYGSTLIITTTDADGNTHERVLASWETDGQLYISTNHWPRSWYRRIKANPEVQINFKGTTLNCRAVDVTGEEHDRVNAEHELGLMFKFMTGFPPRYFYRLDNRGEPDPRVGRRTCVPSVSLG